MLDYEIVFELQAEALRSLEAKAKALRDQIDGQGGDDDDRERLDAIECVIWRLKHSAAPRSVSRPDAGLRGLTGTV